MNPSRPVTRSSWSFLAAIVASIFVPVSIIAQVAPASSAPPQGNALELSVYQVTSTQNTGYTAKSATPFKTSQQLVDIPQAITVVTRDLIDDIGEFDLAKVLVYVGGVPKFGGELFQLRGSNAFSTYPVVDGLISRTVYMDNIFVDSIEIIQSHPAPPGEGDGLG
jgi:catecholate siderophore receptor